MKEQDTDQFMIRLRMGLIAQMETTRALIAASRRLLALVPHKVPSAEQVAAFQTAVLAGPRRARPLD